MHAKKVLRQIDKLRSKCSNFLVKLLLELHPPPCNYRNGVFLLFFPSSVSSTDHISYREEYTNMLVCKIIQSEQKFGAITRKNPTEVLKRIETKQVA